MCQSGGGKGHFVRGEPIGIITITGKEREGLADGFCIARKGGMEEGEVVGHAYRMWVAKGEVGAFI